MTSATQRLAAAAYDVRHAARVLVKTPGFSLLAVLILALGTGVNAAMFSVIDGVMLRSPFVRPEEIASIRAVASTGQFTGLPLESFERLRGLSSVFAATAAWTIASPVVTNVDVPRRTQVECVPASMAAVLGSQPIRGRWFTPAEDQPGGPPVAIVSYNFWKGVLHGADDAVGKTVVLDGSAPITVIGIMARGFDGVFSRRQRDIWAPLGQVTSAGSMYGCRALGQNVNAFVRVQPGVPFERAVAAMNATLSPAPSSPPAPARFELTSIDAETFDTTRRPLIALTGAVLAVLLIACANVANLNLERLVGRRREIAVRLALGASRGRVIRQTVAENLLLAGAGAATGVLIAYVSLGAIVGLLPRGLPHVDNITLDMRVLVASVGLALIGGLVVGLVPAVQASSVQLRGALTEDSRTSTPGSRRLRSTLVVTELALGLALLVGALLMVRTFFTLQLDEPGFDPRDKVATSVRVPAGMTADAKRQMVNALSAEMLTVPGIQAVAVTGHLPLGGSVSYSEVTVAGQTGSAFRYEITTNYLDVMRIPLRRGRQFSSSDNAGALPVALVNEVFVRRLLSNQEPIGMSVRLAALGNAVPAVDVRIVGVIGDMRANGVDTAPRPQVYIPIDQSPMLSAYFIVSGTPSGLANLAPALRQAVARLLPGQLVERFDNLETLINGEVARPRFGAWLLGVFAALAVGLGAIGLGATLAWSVAERRREIGVRMALGAQSRHVAALVVRQTLTLAGIGIVVGLGLAVFGTRLLEGWLYGITTTDATTYAACALLMLLVAFLAAYLPARRATRVDPLVAMRAE